MKQPYTHLTVSGRTAPSIHPESIITELRRKNPCLKFIQFQWQNYSGILRGRVVPIHHCLRLAKENKPLQVPPIAFECVLDNTLVPGLNPTEVDWLLADWDSVRTIAHSAVSEESYATVMCEVLRTTPASSTPDYYLCPRRALGKVMHRAMEDHGLSFLVGFDVEFEIMKVSADGNETIPHSTGLGRFAIAGQREPCFEQVEECIRELHYTDVDIEAFQTAGRRGKYVLSLHPRPPLQAVDELVLVHYRIKRIFARHGHIATMCRAQTV